jgi:hypothetical protein
MFHDVSSSFCHTAIIGADVVPFNSCTSRHPALFAVFDGIVKATNRTNIASLARGLRATQLCTSRLAKYKPNNTFVNTKINTFFLVAFSKIVHLTYGLFPTVITRFDVNFLPIIKFSLFSANF